MNWGKYLTLAIVSFMLFILTLVFIMISKNEEEAVPNYYEKGLNYKPQK